MDFMYEVPSSFFLLTHEEAMKPKVDLSQLAVEREVVAPPASWRSRWQSVVSRVVLPAGLLICFVALLAYAIRDRLSPPRPVTVMPVISAQSTGSQQADTPLFRAVGWVEPRPSPTVVTALAEGVVDKLLVVEGQEVKEGDVVARLIPTDAQIALASAEAEIKLREAELSAATASVTAAKARLDLPLHLKIELADASSALSKMETDLTQIPLQLRAAEAKLRSTREEFNVNKKSFGTVSELVVRKSQSDMEAAEALVEELQSRQKRLPIEAEVLKEKRDALAKKLELKIDEVRLMGEATASQQSAAARLAQAKATADGARLRLLRMDVRAPTSGRVLSVIARPGTRLMGQDPRTLQDSSSVLLLYDPANLQARVDVRLDDVGKVFPGQKATIDSAALGGKQLEGLVLATTSQADIQKNTLSVKVGINSPPPNLKPEMLCQVVLLSPPVAADPAKKDGDLLRLFIPKQLVEGSGDGARVWIVDLLHGQALQRSVQTGQPSGDLVEVTSGLNPTDRLIVGGREGLRNADRVRVTGEDETVGISSVGAGRK